MPSSFAEHTLRVESAVLSSPSAPVTDAPFAKGMRPQQRIDEFDAMRGIAIVFVMYLHAYFGPWSTVPRRELITLHLMLLVANSSVPAFLFMSGFLSARDHSPSFARFFEARLRRVALPLAFWMIAALAFEVWMAGRLTTDLVRAFALFDIAGQFYYVLVLLMLTAAIYPLRHVEDRDLKWFVIAAFVVNVAMIAYYRTHPLEGFWWSMAYRNPLVWVFSFTFGLYLARTRADVRFNHAIITAAGIGMVLVAAIYVYLGERGPGYPNSYFGETVFLFGVLGLIVYPASVRALGRTAVGRGLLWPFRWLAPFAFGIYLVHKPYFIGELSDRAISGGPLSNDYLELVGALFLVGGAASIAFVCAANVLFPRFARLMLGVEQPRVPEPAVDTTAELRRAD